MPPDSAFHRQGRLWTQAHELAATHIERGEHWGSALVQMSGRTLKDGAEPPPGIKITHPDRPEAVPDKKTVSVADLALMLGGR